MKENTYRLCDCEDGHGYYIRRGGGLLTGHEVCMLLDRLDILDEERLKLSDNSQSPLCDADHCGNNGKIHLCKDCFVKLLTA